MLQNTDVLLFHQPANAVQAANASLFLATGQVPQCLTAPDDQTDSLRFLVV